MMLLIGVMLTMADGTSGANAVFATYVIVT